MVSAAPAVARRGLSGASLAAAAAVGVAAWGALAATFRPTPTATAGLDGDDGAAFFASLMAQRGIQRCADANANADADGRVCVCVCVWCETDGVVNNSADKREARAAVSATAGGSLTVVHSSAQWSSQRAQRCDFGWLRTGYECAPPDWSGRRHEGGQAESNGMRVPFGRDRVHVQPHGQRVTVRRGGHSYQTCFARIGSRWLCMRDRVSGVQSATSHGPRPHHCDPGH